MCSSEYFKEIKKTQRGSTAMMLTNIIVRCGKLIMNRPTDSALNKTLIDKQHVNTATLRNDFQVELDSVFLLKYISNCSLLFTLT